MVLFSRRTMRILFTGASSFTGYWFVKELIEAGHEVTAVIRNPLESYRDTRRLRLDRLMNRCDMQFNCPFATEPFFQLLVQKPFDLFCHHAADVTHYKSPDFNPVAALGNNVGPIKKVLEALQKSSIQRILLTGSVFEQNEGAGSDRLRAVSPYGLSKGLTADVFNYYCDVMRFRLGKFVIPNPFGPFEEFRFTSFLMQNWFEEKPVNVTQPAYVRDNIHVSLLAKAYVHFAEQLEWDPGFSKFNPSGYPEAQGSFTMRFATEMRKRLSLPCDYSLAHQKEFPEPKVRINTDLLDADQLKWNEEASWNELAAYYQTVYTPARLQ